MGKRIVFVVLCCVIVILAFLALTNCTLKKTALLNTAKQVAIHHLDKKYHKHFVVLSVKYIDKTGNYQLKACPAGNPDKKFDVYMRPAAAGGISDDYTLS